MEGSGFYLYISGMREQLKVGIVNAHKTYCPPTWRWDNAGAGIELFNLWLILDGRGNIKIGGQDYRLRRGDCFLLRIHEPCFATHDPRHPLLVPWIVFGVKNQAAAGWEPPRIHRILTNVSFMEELMDKAISAFLVGKKSTVLAEDWLRVCLHSLVEEDELASNVDHIGAHTEKIRGLCERIKLDPGYNWMITELARACNISEGHFARIFKAFIGISPRTYVTQTRIEAAKGLLRMSDHNITEIAEILGYTDVFHFSKQFYDKTGIYPTNYRNFTDLKH